MLKVNAIIAVVFFMLISNFSFCQVGSVSGIVSDEHGMPLPGTTIYIIQNEKGTATNVEGYYYSKLEAGSYTIIYRFLGYKTESKRVTLTDEDVTIDVKMTPQSVVLDEVNIIAGKEDPAYIIMRKAIAKSKWNQLIVDKYTSTVYMKGSGRVNQIPFLLRKKMKEEGIDTSRYFVSESVSEITFESPNTVEEKVISIRSSGDDNNSSPNEFITASFYEPELAGTISPLSPRAFTYYNFEYLGYFEDQGNTINRIKVIPKSEGDHVFSGEISIVDNAWSIHSLKLTTTKLGFKFNVGQVYQSFEELAWLPVTHNFEVSGKVLGIGFEYNYLASVNDMKVEINKDLAPTIVVIDKKSEKQKIPDKKESIVAEKGPTKASEKEVALTTRQLKKEAEKFEEELQKEQEDPDLVLTRVRKIDSLAFIRDTDYWEKVRAIPLTKGEEEGYRHVDSLAGNLEKDTLSTTRKKWKVSPLHFLVGHDYRLTKNSYLGIENPLELLGYNTVEGINASYKISFRKNWKSEPIPPKGAQTTGRLSSNLTLRYSAASNRLRPKLDIGYEWLKGQYDAELILSGGLDVKQINNDNPINVWMNTAYTLIGERNYMKIYDSRFLRADFTKEFSDKYKLEGHGTYERRTSLSNQWNYKFFEWENIDFTENNPTSIAFGNSNFAPHDYYGSRLKISARPWLKYKMINGRRRPINDSSPYMNVGIRAGYTNDGLADGKFMELFGGFDHMFDLLLGDMKSGLTMGFFPIRENMYFNDYHHFRGNRTVFQDDGFRLLDYYNFSTNDVYLSSRNAFMIRPNFLLTRIPFIRKKGIKERLIANYLTNPQIGHYYELGYGLDYVFKFLRVEFVSSFVNDSFQMIGFRVGVSDDVNIDFN